MEQEHKAKQQIRADVVQYPQGIKWTRQRKSVYDVLRASSEPMSVLQIYNEASREASGEQYAISTIYRILSVFEKQGFVNKTAWMGDDTALYELERGSHTHYAVCLECHKRIPLDHCPFAHIHLPEEPADFTVTGHKLEIYGYCKNCRSNDDL